MKKIYNIPTIKIYDVIVNNILAGSIEDINGDYTNQPIKSKKSFEFSRSETIEEE